MTDKHPFEGLDDAIKCVGKVDFESITTDSVSGMTPNDRLREFIERTRDSADAVENGGYVNGDHTDGVACGLRWAADELEAVIDDES